MWPNADKDEDLPDWVATEQEQFATFRDKNKDGYMDHDEVMHWIIPPDYDHTKAEAKHLIYESDVNRVRICSVVPWRYSFVQNPDLCSLVI